MHALDDGIQDEGETPRVWNICPLVGPRDGDRVVRPVEVLRISNSAIVCSDQQDALGYKLLLTLVIGDGSPTEDSGDGLGGVLVDKALALVLIFALAVFSFIIVASWSFRWFTAKCFV